MRRGQSSKKVHISFVHVKIYYAFIDEAMKNRLHLLFDLFFYKTRSSLLFGSKQFIGNYTFQKKGKTHLRAVINFIINVKTTKNRASQIKSIFS